MNVFHKGLAAAVIGLAAAAATACQKFPAPSGSLVELRPRMHALVGTPADFDPCNASVEFRTPKPDARSALVIIVHGGAGLGDAERNLATALRSLGYATLVFDAFRMNGFQQDWRFWAEQVTNETRQRMIYQAAIGAYRWALAAEKVDTGRLYLHGLSNGANVVVNMAGAVDPAHVKAAFAEGTMMSGIGVPDSLKVPLRLVFGKLDNYGAQQQDGGRWLIRESCRLNGMTHQFVQPKGSSQRCSLEHNPQALTESPLEWFESQKRLGADIDIWWYEDAAHGMFTGMLNRQTRIWGAADQRFAWTGGSDQARSKFLADFVRYAPPN